MRTKKCLTLGILLCVCICFWAAQSLCKEKPICFPKAAKYSLYQDEGTLFALKAIEVRVLCWSGEEEKKYGLTKQIEQVLQQDVKSQLSGKGIIVLSKQEADGTGGPPSLSISVNPTIIEDCGKAAVYVILELRQKAFLPRLRDACCHAVTWANERSAVCEAEAICGIVRMLVAEQVNKFCSTYIAANQKWDQTITGTIQCVAFDDGIYILFSEDGVGYDPINLPAEYKKDGLQVRFQVKETKDPTRIPILGKVVEVVKIERR